MAQEHGAAKDWLASNEAFKLHLVEHIQANPNAPNKEPWLCTKEYHKRYHMSAWEALKANVGTELFWGVDSYVCSLCMASRSQYFAIVFFRPRSLQCAWALTSTS